ncbi:hypothetical protein BJY52DRAFT_1296469 [Lactarius psammicola]|nr:hypothetical protein BJY52DRAFT_1296469 [Lactarius psammicola]
MKRCGGQGDILSGSVGAFLAWAKCYESGAFGDNAIPASRMPILAAIGASMVTRTTSRRAFEKEGRSVVTQDMLKEIGGAFAEIFGSGSRRQVVGMGQPVERSRVTSIEDLYQAIRCSEHLACAKGVYHYSVYGIPFTLSATQGQNLPTGSAHTAIASA